MNPAIASSDEVSLRRATPEDLPAVLDLLAQAGLPQAGVSGGHVQLFLAETDGQLAGVAGLEHYGTSALLRSVAVSPTQRGRRVAQRLVEKILDEARCACIHDVYLRTTTAEDYFPRFGFAPVTVDQVPEAVRASVEFQGACPASAVTMGCCLDGSSAA